MFGIGFFELAVIAVVALLFVGPKKLPQFMRQAGRFFVQMRRTATDVRSTFDSVINEAENEIRREEAETMKSLFESNESDRAETSPSNESGDSDAESAAEEDTAPPGTAVYKPAPSKGANPEAEEPSRAAENAKTPDTSEAPDDSSKKA